MLIDPQAESDLWLCPWEEYFGAEEVTHFSNSQTIYQGLYDWCYASDEQEELEYDLESDYFREEFYEEEERQQQQKQQQQQPQQAISQVSQIDPALLLTVGQ